MNPVLKYTDAPFALRETIENNRPLVPEDTRQLSSIVLLANLEDGTSHFSV